MKKLQAFFVTPIGEEGSAERKRANALLTHVLNPLFSSRFNISRADLIDTPGNINQDIVERLYYSDLIVADLTGFNPNVMYEVGVCHSFNKPIVQLAQNGQKLPFDVATERTIFFDLQDLDSIEKAKVKLGKAVMSVLSKEKPYRSPILSILNRSAVFEEGGDVAEALETLSERIDMFANGMWDVASEAAEQANFGIDDSVERQIAKIYDVISAISPWEADRLAQKLRKL